MNVQDVVNSISSYTQQNSLAAVSAAIIILFVLFWKPKWFFILCLSATAIIGLIYLFSSLSHTGLRNIKIPFFH